MKTIQRSELPTAPGTALAGGFFTGILMLNSLAHAVVTAGIEGELTGKWGERGVKIKGAAHFVDGLANTDAMAASGSDLAVKARALRIGGFDDWSIPARNQQELQYRNLKPTTRENYCSYLDGYNPDSVPPGELYTEESPAQTLAENFREGGVDAFAGEWYWSSTQHSAHTAFGQTFVDGSQDDGYKDIELRARAVRMIQIID